MNFLQLCIISCVGVALVHSSDALEIFTDQEAKTIYLDDQAVATTRKRPTPCYCCAYAGYIQVPAWQEQWRTTSGA